MGNVFNHFCHILLKDFLFIIIQIFKKSPYLIDDLGLVCGGSSVILFELPYGVPTLPFLALILKEFCILVYVD